MAATSITYRDLSREVADVARGLTSWRRGEPEEAALETLAFAAGRLHNRTPTVWAWTARTALGEPAVLLPLPASVTIDFAPRSQARVLTSFVVVATDLDADPAALRFEDWRGYTCMACPRMVPDLLADALREVYPPPDRVSVAPLPEQVVVGGPALELRPTGRARGDGVPALARELGVHPLRVIVTLVAHNQPVSLDEAMPELATSLREWGCVGEPAPAAEHPAPSLEIEDDPCPRRRHARTVLQRMLRMGKVGPGYHTEFDHFARGAAAHERRQALEVGEALLRAGLLGEKPSVGQRHIYLNVKALPDIHALIDRGETRDPNLAAAWTAPAPGATATRAGTARSR